MDHQHQDRYQTDVYLFRLRCDSGRRLFEARRYHTEDIYYVFPESLQAAMGINMTVMVEVEARSRLPFGTLWKMTRAKGTH